MGIRTLLSFAFITTLSIPTFGDASRTVQMDYDQVRKEIQKQLHARLGSIYKLNCAGQGITTRTPSGYNCGELPFGRIINGHQKEIFHFKMKKGRIKNIPNGHVDLSNEVNFQLLLDRAQHGAWEKIDIIDYRDRPHVRIKREIYNNIFLRFYQGANQLNTVACTYLPGLIFRSPMKKINLHGQQRKKIAFWWKTLRFSGSANVDPGYARFQPTKLCSVFKTRLVGNTVSGLNQSTQLVALGYPQVKPFNIHGLKVTNVKAHVHGWLARLIVGVLKTFGVLDAPALIRAEIEKGIRQTIDSRLRVSKQDIMSGRYFSKILATHQIKTPLTRNINSALLSSINSSTSNVRVFEQSIEDQCYRSFAALEHRTSANFSDREVNNFCRGLTAQVVVRPFERNRRELNLGCYARYFPVQGNYNILNRPRNPKWRTQCHAATRIIVRGPASSSDTQQCLLNNISNGNSQFATVNNCIDTVVRDFSGLRTLNDLRQVMNSSDPVGTMMRMGFTRSAAQRISRLLGAI